MYHEENPFTLDPSLKSLLTFKEQEKNSVPKEEYFEKPHDRLYYTYKGSTQYGLIKKLEEQAFGISDMRTQILAGEKPASSKSSLSDKRKTTTNMRKTELPTLNSNKTININQVVKEKKETLGEFLGKGKHIFLGKMMMDMKREETLRLTEFIINEEETINEHEADFREHVKFSNQFIQDLNRDAEKTINESKEKMKEINKEHILIAQLEQNIRSLESQIKKKEEDKETYETYKKFFYELYEPAIKALPKQLTPVKKEDPNKFFVTQKGQGEGKPDGEPKDSSEDSEDDETETENEEEFDKFNNPKQMVELLKRIDDATIFLIHNTQEKEEDLEKTKKAFEQQRQQINEKYNNRKEALAQVQKLHEKVEKDKIQAQEKLGRLRLLEKAPQNLEENEGLDKARIAQKIYSMWREISKDESLPEAVPHDFTSDDTLKLMANLEKELEQLMKFYDETKVSERNLEILTGIEKEIIREKRQLKAKAKQESDRQKGILALAKQQQKKVVLRKGRKPMGKMWLEKEEEAKEELDDDANKNDDEKYFKDNFTFLDAMKHKPHANTTHHDK
jgi:hypothetical protein